MVGQAPGAGLRGGVHRRDHGQSQGRAGPQPAGVRRDRGGPGRAQGHPGHVGRGRRRGVGEVLVRRPERPEVPRSTGRVLRGLRRTQGPARLRERRVPTGHGADLHHPPDPWDLPLRLEEVLGRARQGPETGLHRPDRRGSRGRPGGGGGQVGRPVPGDQPAVARGVDGVRALPGLRSLLQNRVLPRRGLSVAGRG